MKASSVVNSITLHSISYPFFSFFIRQINGSIASLLLLLLSLLFIFFCRSFFCSV
ncbi:hypothetical protein BDF14DRAFT_1774176 [Spinellus fusiger]|nr:hypothetical protein BDF14DRAFT_1774176 [Spinellus fusiger]